MAVPAAVTGFEYAPESVLDVRVCSLGQENRCRIESDYSHGMDVSYGHNYRLDSSLSATGIDSVCKLCISVSRACLF